MTKKRIFITGSADGLGLAAAKTLIGEGHEVIVHVRSKARLSAVKELVDKGVIAVAGDLANFAEVEEIGRQVNQLGHMDAVIHNAGVYRGPITAVNVVAPYVLTALIKRPNRLIYLSSGLHRSGSPKLDSVDFSDRTAGNYSDSKLFITTLSSALARKWPDVVCSAVDPGWVPTKMGGPNATDDLLLGHTTQEWLAVSDEPEALVSGAYWYHKERGEPHTAASDENFQKELLDKLEKVTAYQLS